MMNSLKNHRIEIIALGLIILVFLAIGIAYININPTWSAPDELAHFAYVEYLIEHGSLPTYEHHLSIWEAHQPPLYYFLGVPIILAFQNSNFDIQAGSLRVFSLLLGAFTIIVAYLTAKKIFPENKYLQIGAVILVALLPMFSYISASINNDNLANLMGSLLLFFIVLTAEKKLSKKELFISGLLAAFSLLTKATLLPLVFVLFLAVIWQSRKKIMDVLYLFIIPVITVSGWWFVRNMVIYGDMFGWSVINKIWAAQYKNIFLKDNFINWWKLLYKSFFGILGKFNIILPNYAYRIFALLLILAFAGLVFTFIFNKRTASGKKISLGLLSVCFALTLGGVFYNSIKFYQPQGRYLFPVIAAFAILAMAGLHAVFPKKIRALALFALIAFLLLGNVRAIMSVRSYYQKNIPVDYQGKNLIADRHLLWYNQGQIKEFLFSNGSLVTESLGNEPRIASPNDLKLDSNKINKIIIAIKASNGTSAQIYWRTITDMQFYKNNNIKFDLIADNDWHTYELDFSERYKKPTLINQFRIIPTNEISSVEIKQFTIQ